MSEPRLCVPKRDLQGTALWTTQGLRAVTRLYRSLILILEELGKPHGMLLSTQYEPVAAYDAFFGDKHAGRQRRVTPDLYLAPESNLITFPALLSGQAWDILAVSLVQRYRVEQRPCDIWRERSIWPALGLNAVARDDDDLTSAFISSIHAELLRRLGLPTIEIMKDLGDYGTQRLLVTEFDGRPTGLSMVYELGRRFTSAFAYPDARLLNSGLTGKTLLVAACPERVRPPTILDHLLFPDAAVTPICLPCVMRVGWTDNGTAHRVQRCACLLCGSATPPRLISKSNAFY